MDDPLERRRRRRTAERRTFWLIVGGVIGSLLLLLAVAWAWLALGRRDGEPPPNPFAGGAASEPPPFDRAAHDALEAEYRANEVKATRVYVGRRFRLSGKVMDIRAPDVAVIFVEGGGNLGNRVQMRGRQVERLTTGQAVTLDATLARYSVLGSAFSDGSLVE